MPRKKQRKLCCTIDILQKDQVLQAFWKSWNSCHSTVVLCFPWAVEAKSEKFYRNLNKIWCLQIDIFWPMIRKLNAWCIVQQPHRNVKLGFQKHLSSEEYSHLQRHVYYSPSQRCSIHTIYCLPQHQYSLVKFKYCTQKVFHVLL